MTTRRGFLGAILAAGVAPAIAGSGVLMPVRKIWTPEHRVFTGPTSITLNTDLFSVGDLVSINGMGYRGIYRVTGVVKDILVPARIELVRALVEP